MVRNLWVVVEPTPDVPGEWLAHCLDLDTASQGTSPAHALSLLVEAIAMAVSDDLSRKADPFERRAPEEDWDRLWQIMREGERGQFDQLQSKPGLVSLALPIELRLGVGGARVSPIRPLAFAQAA